jgi:hypothetical protein
MMNDSSCLICVSVASQLRLTAPRDGATPLHWAVYRDDVQAVDRLIAAGANVRAANREGVTPLAMASLYGSLPIVDGCSRQAPMRKSAGRTAKRR